MDTTQLKQVWDTQQAVRTGLQGALRESTPVMGTEPPLLANPKPGDCMECGKPFDAHSPTQAPGGHHFSAMPNLSPAGSNLTHHGPTANYLGGLHHAPGALTESVGASGALDRLAESIHPRHTYAPDKTGPTEAQHDAADMYNAHSLAAHRSSVAAFMGKSGMGGSQATHKVAADHHRLAAKAASAAAKLHGANSQNNKDYKTAADYHNKQADAHEAMATTNKRGNTQPGSYELSVTTSSY